MIKEPLVSGVFFLEQNDELSVSLHTGGLRLSDAHYSSHCLVCILFLEHCLNLAQLYSNVSIFNSHLCFSLSSVHLLSLNPSTSSSFILLLVLLSFKLLVNASFTFNIPHWSDFVKIWRSNAYFPCVSSSVASFPVCHNLFLSSSWSPFDVNATQPQEVHSLVSLLTAQAWPH